jgi:hypothetical protein
MRITKAPILKSDPGWRHLRRKVRSLRRYRRIPSSGFMAKGVSRRESAPDWASLRGTPFSLCGARAVAAAVEAAAICQGAKGDGVCCHGEWEVSSLLPSEPEKKLY